MAEVFQVTHSAKQGTDLQLFILRASIKVCRAVQGSRAQPRGGV